MNTPKWMRFMIQPPEGYALIAQDYRNQEPGIAGALSGDENLMRAYRSGDIYSWMAIQSGYMPKGGSRKTHPQERNIFKRLVLATQYGARAESLAEWIQSSIGEAEKLIRWHRRIFRDFWKWQKGVVSYALYQNQISTNHGWTLHLKDKIIERPNGDTFVQETNLRMLQNYQMQGTGSHILQWAMMLGWDHGLEITCPIHDAWLVQCRIEDIEETVELSEEILREASRIVLPHDFEIDVDTEICVYPNRLGSDDKGAIEMWNRVCELIPEVGEL